MSLLLTPLHYLKPMIKYSTLHFTVFSLLIMHTAVAAQTAAENEITASLAQQKNVAITIYNDDLALIKDSRTIELNPGENHIAFREVSAHIQPETALLRSLNEPNRLQLIEQNFDFDLLTPQKLLEKYVGNTVSIIKTHPTTGEETSYQAKVLSANQGVVLQIGNTIETGLPGRIVYGNVPPTLRDRPTLTISLENHGSRTHDLELSYLTRGLSWKADYVAELSSDDKQLDLNGWVTLTNTSGTGYHHASLQLIAGDIHRVRESKQRPMIRRKSTITMTQAAAPMKQEALFEYHLYSLPRQTTLLQNQTKQIALLTANQIPVDKEFLLQGQNYYYQTQVGDLGKKLKIGIYLNITNNKTSNLGLPLPKGIVRVYKRDQKGNTQFVGEDQISHTPKNEKIRLKLGEAFDITAHKKQTDFQKRSGFNQYNYEYESAYQIILKNAKNETVMIKVREPLPGDWKIITENTPHTKDSAHSAFWQMKVPAEGQTTLEYRVRIRQ